MEIFVNVLFQESKNSQMNALTFIANLFQAISFYFKSLIQIRYLFEAYDLSISLHPYPISYLLLPIVHIPI